jgi:hypothetical protein
VSLIAGSGRTRTCRSVAARTIAMPSFGRVDMYR